MAGTSFSAAVDGITEQPSLCQVPDLLMMEHYSCIGASSESTWQGTGSISKPLQQLLSRLKFSHCTWDNSADKRS